VAAQLAVLGLVLAFPAILWRDSTEAAAATTSVGDADALQRMLDQPPQ
jgi:hypothetical protein